jgi:two-component system, sensor histidine kinase PdtaS
VPRRFAAWIIAGWRISGTRRRVADVKTRTASAEKSPAAAHALVKVRAGTPASAPWLTAMERLLQILPAAPRPWPVRYALTALIMLVCCALQYLIFRISGFTGFFILLPGIFLSGLLFNRGSALFGTLIGCLFAVYILFPGFQLPSNAVYVPLILFVLTGFFIALVAEALRKAIERIATAERQKDLLLRELRHRTKNDIMSITSVLRIQARQAATPDIRDALMDAAGRVDVMGEVQTFLENSPVTVNLRAYLTDLCQRLSAAHRGVRPINIVVEAEEAHVKPEHTLPLGMIVNELVTNSLKYAFPRGRPGRIGVSVRDEGGPELVMRVEDDGVGCADDPPEGTGSVLMKLMTRQIGGSMIRETSAQGCAVTVRIPKTSVSKA